MSRRSAGTGGATGRRLRSDPRGDYGEWSRETILSSERHPFSLAQEQSARETAEYELTSIAQAAGKVLLPRAVRTQNGRGSKPYDLSACRIGAKALVSAAP